MMISRTTKANLGGTPTHLRPRSMGFTASARRLADVVCVASLTLALAACGVSDPPTASAAKLFGRSTNQLTVVNGLGPLSAQGGDIVEAWSTVAPQTEVVTRWTGADFTSDPEEWHVTLKVGATATVATAEKQTSDLVLETASYQAPTAVVKTVRFYIPQNPKGLIIFLHGTSGSSQFIENLEPRYLALKAILQGYAVMGPEAEESRAGDLDGNGKARWFPQLTNDNVDLRALDTLLEGFFASGRLSRGLPLYAVGMSNGGAMAVSLGAVGNSAVASGFPNLRFKAVVSYCSEARNESATATSTPTAFYLCAQDDNPEVSNGNAQAQSDAIVKRGIASVALLHPPTPLYDERFGRVVGVTFDRSRSLSAEFRKAEFVNSAGFIALPSQTIQARIASMPGSFPVFNSFTPAQRQEIGNQIRVLRAEHEFYSDWSAKTLKWLQSAP